MRLYLIAGKAKSGKTQTANILKDLLEEKGEKVVITEYSKYIKLFAKDLLGWDGKEPKPRDFLQKMGNYVREQYGDIYFVQRMKEDLQIYDHFVDDVIISDVRMPQELDELSIYQPIKIKVVNCLDEYNLTEAQASHITEHALDNYYDFDYVIENKEISEIKEILKQIIESR